MLHIATTDGTIVQLRRTNLIANQGQHAGRRFRIDEIQHDGRQHIVVASRKHSSKLRHTIKVLPEVFGLVITEIEEITRELLGIVKRIGTQIVELLNGLYVGTLALIPLAYFEHYELADKIVQFFHWIF